MAKLLKESILHPKMQGMMIVSGLQGLGKSTFSFNAERPELTAILDYDQKGEPMARDYGIEQYHAPNFMKPEQDPTDYDAFQLALWSMKVLHEKIKEGTTTVIFDDATSLEPGLGMIVAKNPAKYGVRADNVTKGMFGGVNPGVSILWKNITQHLQTKGVKLIIMVNHMTSPWVDSKPMPNRWHVKGNKIFRQLSVLSLIMVPGEEKRGGVPPVPSALVIKEMMANRRWNETALDYENERTLPMRIPVAKWKNIKDYFEIPASFSEPAAGESWTQFELNAYGEFLSPEQLAWIKETAKITYSEDGPGRGAPESRRDVFKRELLESKWFKSTAEITAAMGDRKYSEATHVALRDALLAEKQAEHDKMKLSADSADLREIAGDPKAAG